MPFPSSTARLRAKNCSCSNPKKPGIFRAVPVSNAKARTVSRAPRSSGTLSASGASRSRQNSRRNAERSFL